MLDLIICEALYQRFPELLEGDLTKIKSAVVSRRTCAEVSQETKLIDLLIIGKGISSREQMPSSLAAAVYESIVAAIYLDGGFDVGFGLDAGRAGAGVVPSRRTISLVSM